MAVGNAAWRRPWVVDSLAIAGVPAVLGAVFALPRGLRSEHVLAYSRPTLVDALASHYVHLAADHLLANLFWYTLLVVPAYLLLVRTGNRDVFRAAFVTFLLAFPLAISGVNVLLPRPWTSVAFGFSAVVMAFAGLLTVALGGSLAERYGLTTNYVPGVFLLGSAVIVGQVIGGSVTVSAAIVGVAIAVVPAVGRFRHDCVRTASLDRSETWLILAGTLVLGAALVVAFSTQSANGQIVNLLAHLLGYCFGAVVPHTAALLDGHPSVPSALDGRAD